MQWTKLIQQKRIDNRLTVELTPATIRSKSLFSFLIKNNKMEEWTDIKNELLLKEGAKCWICGIESNHLHLHEFWNYNDKEHKATLREIHHLCDLCDKIKRSDFWFFTNFGVAQLKQLGLEYKDLIEHYCKVNNCSEKEFTKNWHQAVTQWQKRNEVKWQQDYGRFL